MLYYRRKILIFCLAGFKEFQTFCIGFQAVEITPLCYIVLCWINTMGFTIIKVCSNLVLDWWSNIQCGPLLQHASFKISYVRTANVMYQISISCILVLQYASITCQCGASGILSQRIALYNLTSPSCFHAWKGIWSTCRAPSVYPLQIEAASCLSFQNDGCCDYQRPLIMV